MKPVRYLTLLSLLSLNACGIGLSGDIGINIPGDHELALRINEPTKLPDARRAEDKARFGFPLEDVRSKEDLQAKLSSSARATEQSSESICVPLEDYFYLDAPTVPEFGIQPYKDHYESCQLHAYQLNIALGECRGQLPEPPEPVDPQCGSCVDGGGGFLWKPVSEGNNGSVVILNSSRYKGTGLKFNVEGVKVVRESCCANGDRQHWYINKTGASLPKNTTVTFSDGKCCLIPDPSKRYD